MSGVVNLPQPPNRIQIVDKDGFMTPDFVKWMQQLYNRVGGANAVSNIVLNGIPDTHLLAGPFSVGFAAPVLCFTSPAGIDSVIDSIEAHNNSLAELPLFVWAVPYGDAIADKYLIYNSKIASGVTQTLPNISNVVLGSGATIWMQTTNSGTGIFDIVNINGRQAS